MIHHVWIFTQSMHAACIKKGFYESKEKTSILSLNKYRELTVISVRRTTIMAGSIQNKQDYHQHVAQHLTALLSYDLIVMVD